MIDIAAQTSRRMPHRRSRPGCAHRMCVNMDDFDIVMKPEREPGFPLVMVTHKPTNIIRLCDNTKCELLNASKCIEAIARCLEGDLMTPWDLYRRRRPLQRQFR